MSEGDVVRVCGKVVDVAPSLIQRELVLEGRTIPRTAQGMHICSPIPPYFYIHIPYTSMYTPPYTFPIHLCTHSPILLCTHPHTYMYTFPHTSRYTFPILICTHSPILLCTHSPYCYVHIPPYFYVHIPPYFYVHIPPYFYVFKLH